MIGCQADLEDSQTTQLVQFVHACVLQMNVGNARQLILRANYRVIAEQKPGTAQLTCAYIRIHHFTFNDLI